MARSIGPDFLDQVAAMAAAGTRIGRLNDGALTVVDAMLCRQILENRDGGFVEHSDFFWTQAGIYGPRARQRAFAAESRRLVKSALDSFDIAAQVARLPSESHWPRAGCKMLWVAAAPLLLDAGRTQAMHDALSATLEARIFARGQPANLPGRFSAYRRRKRFIAAFQAEMDRPGDDLLAMTVRHGGRERPALLAELYLALAFSLVSSVGLALAWSFKAALVEGLGDCPAHHVRETLRLYPVAWQFGRRTTKSMVLDETTVAADQDLSICIYGAHRHPAYWKDADRFDPTRWVRDERSALFWMPFGAGTHICPAAGISMTHVERCLIALMRRRPQLWQQTSGVDVGAALAPAEFVVRFAA